ncbi:hypothetical protein IC617_01615 [Neiella sp. HB171785]|uniref:Uncharacterized protein n=1 Tax=Neiella litorisoli TaxID=2771431 RepID=A0A8J6QNQ2_9GAMM|nr:DUF6702 family protein [Neiella litorisoli]MBD1388116.1 hypothetical protein [Neiella litorisoli]
MQRPTTILKAWIGSLLVLWLMSCGTAMAHTYHAIRTTMTLNEQTGSVEIIHRVFANDLAAVLGKAKNQRVELSDSAEHQQWTAQYWQRYFAVLDHHEQPLELSWVGMEIDDHYVWVYQEYQGDVAKLIASDIHNGLLMGQFDHQINTVDVVLADHQSALVFSEAKLRQPIQHDSAPTEHHH